MITLLAMMADILGATDSTAPLWNALNAGDTPAIVAEKLGKLPEVSKVKLKPSKKAGKEPDVEVDVKDAGYVILEDAFQIDPVFNGGTLKTVSLTTGQTCRNTAFSRYVALVEALRGKYPDVAHEAFAPKDKSEFIQAELDHLNGKAGVVRTAMTNGTTTVYVTVDIATITRPASYVGGGLAGALNSLQWSIYRGQAAECGGTGDQRAVFQISYFAKSDFDAMMAEVKEQMSTDKATATDRL